MAGLNSPLALSSGAVDSLHGKEGVMVKTTLTLVCVLALGIVAPLGAKDDSSLKFNGGIGVIPVSNVAQAVAGGPVTVSRNTVRGVPSPGQIWVIRALKAEVDASSNIKVRGRGLLLGGGNGIGTNAGQSVRATVICEPAAPFVEHSTADVVPLEANGDFEIDAPLDPPLPAMCASPVLLIRNGGGSWFAAGILDLNEDN
jgi:hypothetical protein